MDDALVAAARRHLDAGRGLDLVLAELDAAQLSTLPRIVALREAAGLGLADAVNLIEAARAGTSLAHLTRAHLDLIRRARAAAQADGWTNLYCDAVVAQRPWLTMIPVPPTTPGLGAVYYWTLPGPPPTTSLWLAERGPASPEQRQAFLRRLDEDPELAASAPASISGPDVRYEDLRAGLRGLAERDPFWREHVTLVRDADDALTCRFRIAP